MDPPAGYCCLSLWLPLLPLQMGVAVYFLDKLALRAGHEKDDDEADTVGCCTLKVSSGQQPRSSVMQHCSNGCDRTALHAVV